MSDDARHPLNTVAECRHPGLPCDRACLECRGDFDVVDGKTGRRVGDVDDATAWARLLAEFGGATGGRESDRVRREDFGDEMVTKPEGEEPKKC